MGSYPKPVAAKGAPAKKGSGNALTSMWSKAPPAKPKLQPASAPAAGAAGKRGGSAKITASGKGKAAASKAAPQRAVDADAALRLQQVLPYQLPWLAKC